MFFNDGHTVQVNINQTSFITVTEAASKYQFLQFHFHSPSEHTIDNNHYPLEVHLVHKSADGSFAVLGYLVKQDTYTEGFLQTLSKKIHEIPQYVSVITISSHKLN